MKSIQSTLGAVFGSVVIAFAMTLFIPSMANATNSESATKSCQVDNSSKDCSTYEKKAEYYKKKASYYLTKYNSSNCYTYYKKRLYYTKKYEAYKKKADECKNTTVNCDPYKAKADKYKKYADKYKYYMDTYYAKYKKYNNSCYYKYYLCYKKKYEYYMNLYDKYKNKYDECIVNQTPKGSLYSFVWLDTNNNGEYEEDTDTRIAGVSVKITDSEGNVFTVTTDSNGLWDSGRVLAEGTATIKIDESTLPENLVHFFVDDPTYADVVAGEDVFATSDGYTLFDPTTGKAWGFIWLDSNDNGQYDETDTRLENVSVVVTDAEGNEKTLVTDSNGIWHTSGLSEGTLTIDIVESTLPANTVQIFGSDPSTFDITPNADVFTGSDGYQIVHP